MSSTRARPLRVYVRHAIASLVVTTSMTCGCSGSSGALETTAVSPRPTIDIASPQSSVDRPTQPVPSANDSITDWTVHPLPTTSVGFRWSIASTSTRFIVGGGSNILTSTDLANWVKGPTIQGRVWEVAALELATTAFVESESGPPTWVTSTSGTSWDRNGTLPGDTSNGPIVQAATRTDSGLLAFARGAERLTSWRSADGVSWSVPKVGTDRGAVLGLVAAGSTEVAVGSTGADAAQLEAAWVSTEDEHWQQSTLTPTPVAISTFSAVAAGPDGYVAVAAENGFGVGASWSSPDGTAWTRNPAFPGDVIPKSVAAVPGGWIAFGAIRSKGVAVVSRDGRTWRTVALPDSIIDDVVVAGNRIIGVGLRGAQPVVVEFEVPR